MPIKSYIAQPHENRKDELIRSLSALPQCELLPAENKDVVIIVTDTKDQNEEEHIQHQLETIESLKLLTMVSGFNPKKDESHAQ